MNNQNNKILNEVAQYYTDKIVAHGDTPQGVDWNGEDSQFLRFEQLCKVINGDETFSINDIGCGYGALLDFMTKQYEDFHYYGIDVSAEMIETANKRYTSQLKAEFIKASEPNEMADYSVASGVFNVRLTRTDQEWQTYIEETIAVLNASSRLGFAFNCLTSYSDEDKMRDYLYYANPCSMFDICKQQYSKQVALLHDYGLYEFTILVRK